jgi:hypothetical protein
MIYFPDEKGPEKLFFKTDSKFKAIDFAEVDFWTFSFANEICVTIEGGFWRILRNNKIMGVSFDHLHQFGLPAPINLVADITEILKDKILKEVKILETTGDLILSISDDITIEVFITSSGYESYSFYIDNKIYVGAGSGKIAMYNIK